MRRLPGKSQTSADAADAGIDVDVIEAHRVRVRRLERNDD
jgi:hypothetical protein